MMYLSQSINDGLSILGFDKKTIKKVSKEKSLEEIFLSTLFLNYVIVLVVYCVALVSGGFSIAGRSINMPIFFGLLMVYPFAYNVIIYLIYGFFGVMAEMIDSRKHVKPLVAVGFHTGIVYSVLVYVIALISTADAIYGLFVLCSFLIYFLYVMFLSISIIYEFTLPHTLIVLFIPVIILGFALLFIGTFYPQIYTSFYGTLF